MISNPTIDGVSRELLLDVEYWFKHMETEKSVEGRCSALTELRALLAAPVVERREAILQASFHWNDIWVDVGTYEFNKRAADPFTYKVRTVYTAPPQLAELQEAFSESQEEVVKRGRMVAELQAEVAGIKEGMAYRGSLFGRVQMERDELQAQITGLKSALVRQNEIQRAEIDELQADRDSLRETFDTLIDKLGIDRSLAQKEPGKPSGVFAKHVNELQATIERQAALLADGYQYAMYTLPTSWHQRYKALLAATAVLNQG